MGRLCDLHDAGVSIWLDTLSRHLLTTGAFQTLTDRACVTGATSNPTIFAAAIRGADGYDDQLQACLNAGMRDPEAIFFELALTDVGHAADLLDRAYQASGGTDGFVSFECTPDLADDTDATIEQAITLWTRLDRPNVMIKVPATSAGIGAINQLTAEGVNVNVTLLFALHRYEQVIDAYMSGIEQRLAKGQTVDRLASVASFFVSRVDAKVDDRLSEDSALRGQTAIANAKLAYQLYTERFADERWNALTAQAAGAQRPLWASTGTKNPNYSDVMYVEELIGPDVVSTMPDKTLRAFDDHGKVQRTIDAGIGHASDVLAELPRVGVDLDAITTDLEREGVASFCDSYHQLLTCITEKASSVGVELSPPPQTSAPSDT